MTKIQTVKIPTTKIYTTKTQMVKIPTTKICMTNKQTVKIPTTKMCTTKTQIVGKISRDEFQQFGGRVEKKAALVHSEAGLGGVLEDDVVEVGQRRL